MTHRRKLIEVAMPLEAINEAAAKEKSIRHGHPSTLHLWWARRPLAACRAVLFGQLVDDPSSVPEEFPTEDEQDAERERLHGIIEAMVPWKASNDERVLNAARREIARSVARWRADRGEDADVDARMRWENPTPDEVNRYLAEHAPPVHDPFCGGGSIPLEAQRLGLRAVASDLNPVAVLITKALVEIPPKFAGMPPVNPEARAKAAAGAREHSPQGARASGPHEADPAKDGARASGPHEARGRQNADETSALRGERLFASQWRGAEGLAEDVRYYGQWMRDEAEKRIGHLYPKVEVTPEMAEDRPDLEKYVGRELTVIAWLWARTVTCPNPACGVTMPLAASYWLSKKKRRKAWLEPVVENGARASGPHEAGGRQNADETSALRVGFRVRTGDGAPPEPPKIGRGAKFRCECCGQVTDDAYIKAEGMAGRMGQQLMAVVLEGDRERMYIPPIQDHERIAGTAEPQWKPDQELPNNARWFSPPLFGMTNYGDLFTPRQLVALTTFSDLVAEARERVEADARAAGMPHDGAGLEEGGSGCAGYADAVATYLAFAVSRDTDYLSTISTWASNPQMEIIRGTFARQALPMTWDFAEGNVFGPSSGSLHILLGWIEKVLRRLDGGEQAVIEMLDSSASMTGNRLVCATDPPYYDNIGYADLSDFFYVWLRRSLRDVFPSLFGTMVAPKDRELIATPYRDRSNGKLPREFFEDGLREAFSAMRRRQAENQVVSLFYAFKQAEADDETGAVSSTGWDTMLAGLLKAGLSVDATWPVRTERSGRSIGIGANALASSIVLACRPRRDDAPLGTRNEFVAELRRELPQAVERLQAAAIAPVDLAQSAIGPGMAVFSRYAKVLEPSGDAMTVRQALGLINQVLDEVLAAEEAEYDPDTRWAVTWFSQYGHDTRPYGEAEVLATARDTSVDGLVRAGILEGRGGKVRLLRRDELEHDWDPAEDERFTVWEACQHLIRSLEQGETAAAELLRRLGSAAEPARQLAYRLYQHCERKRWADEARAYNTLAVAWPRLTELAAAPTTPEGTTGTLDFGTPEEEQ